MKLLGFDEAGRGPWAGPIFVAIVCLNAEIDNLTDSKKLSALQREHIYQQIIDKADYVGVGSASSDYIDSNGLTAATIYSAKQAISGLANQHGYELIIDGNVDYLPEFENKQLVVKADKQYPCVSAASVVAKVLRDRFMVSVAQAYPEYGFDKHMGYGTKLHSQAIERYGICSQHRKSFRPIKKYL